MSHSTTVDQVLKRLETLDKELPDTDGVKWFNKLYLEVTQQVAAVAPTMKQEAPGFLPALDVFFGNRYFDAFDAAAHHRQLPGDYPFHAWKPLFAARHDKEIAPVQFALAGMNAHINHDLAIGVCDTCASRGSTPGDPEHKDYDSVNGLISKVEQQMKAWLMTGLLKELDETFNPVDDIVAVWDVERARDAAWIRAQVIWSLRDAPSLQRDYEAVNDRATGLAGRALLIPVGLRS
ncbi:MAG TPA: DUF5995 family protein [Thermoleophilaceae bacterium]